MSRFNIECIQRLYTEESVIEIATNANCDGEFTEDSGYRITVRQCGCDENEVEKIEFNVTAENLRDMQCMMEHLLSAD